VKAHGTLFSVNESLHRLKSGVPFIAVLLLLTSCVAPPLTLVTGEEHGDPQLLSEVDGLVRTLMRKNHIPGLSIGMVHEGKTLVLRGYGSADLENEIPVTPDTIFRAYSIAKLLTGLEVVRLAEEGLIDLDEPLESAVPEWSGMRYHEPSEPVTVRHLLAHRGGLPRNSNFHPDGGVPIDEVLRLTVESMAGTRGARPAGVRYQYSNVGYNVLGRAVEVARNKSFAVYMSYDALPDYGMDRSAFFTGFLPDDAQLATGYVREKRRFHPTELHDLNELASGNLFTSAADMAAFMTTVLETTPESEGPLSIESLRASYQPQFASPDDPERTGLAWATSEALAGELMVWHQGGDADADAVVALFPDSRTGVCLLSNSSSFGVMLVVDCLRALRAHQGTIGPPPAGPPAKSPADKPAPEQVAGRYVVSGQLMNIRTKGTDLKINFADMPSRWMSSPSLSMEPVARTERGMEYALNHKLLELAAGLFPLELELVRIIVSPLSPGEEADHIWFSISDCAYGYCPRYPVPSEIPGSWRSAEGEYDGCMVTVKDDALHMSGVGYLREREPGFFEVVGGIYDGETVARDPATGALSHQGILYERK
jgi:CubicO group peptidase (beta-lactamase class C family)